MTVLACDVGGSRIKLGVVGGGRILASDVIPADSQLGLAQALPRIALAFDRLQAESGVQVADCCGIGMGFPALVDSRRCKILNEYGKYADAPQVDLSAWAAGTFDLPLAIDNDARLALMGEWTHGAGRGSNNLAIITLGTGIGTAVVLEGRVLRGQHFSAGNLMGHSVVNMGGRECSCGVRGTVESETGSVHLEDRARRVPGFDESALAQCDRVDYAAVCRAAASGDAVAVEVLRQASDIWGALCVNMIQAFDLDRVVIGGGVMESAEIVLPMIQGYVAEHAGTWWGTAEILAAEHPRGMALLGCEALVNEIHGQRDPRSNE
ncbi:MAG: ROK family protein [Planctomycetota bacterium]